jgi:glycosyltransferase involved in cell wall biosynthesis
MLSQADLHRAMLQSCAVVNSSRSEGLANALLEAMYVFLFVLFLNKSTLGVPVIARDCPGNCTIVRDHETGFTFHSAEEFIAKAEHLLESPESAQRVINGGKRLIESQYSIQNERNLYQKLVSNIL